jgi:hypothetical protein
MARIFSTNPMARSVTRATDIVKTIKAEGQSGFVFCKIFIGDIRHSPRH